MQLDASALLVFKLASIEWWNSAFTSARIILDGKTVPYSNLRSRTFRKTNKIASIVSFWVGNDGVKCISFFVWILIKIGIFFYIKFHFKTLNLYHLNEAVLKLEVTHLECKTNWSSRGGLHVLLSGVNTFSWLGLGGSKKLKPFCGGFGLEGSFGGRYKPSDWATTEFSLPTEATRHRGSSTPIFLINCKVI